MRAASQIGIAALAVAAAFGGVACAPSSAPPATAQSAPLAHPAFIEDDYARALAEARATKRPLFIDAWAAWCHTCLSMRSYVFTDAAISPYADKMVWLAIDTEKPENAAFLEKYPMSFWPTLWVVEAEHETKTLKWVGSATGPELAQLLEDATGSSMSDSSAGEASAALLRAKQASASAKRADAIAEYRAALAAAPAGWKRRPQASEALAGALEESKDAPACVTFARAEAPKLPPGTSKTNVAASGLHCALSDATTDPAALAELAAMVTQIAQDMTVPILADDRSSLFESLVEMHSEAKNAAAKKATASAWATFLEGEAARAKSPDARAVFDAHRVEAYFALGQPERAVPMLKASEHDFPNDYNPRVRLARAFLEMKRFDEALVAVDGAIARVYGGRELRVRGVKVDILVAKGDASGAATALREAIARASKQNLPPNYVRLRDAMAKRLTNLEGTAEH